MTTPTQSVPEAPPADLGSGTASFDPEAFEPLTGREEAWRFTPLRRIRGVHETFEIDTDPKYLAPDTVSGVDVAVVDAGHDVLDRALPPTDRVAALAWQAMRRAAVLTISEDADPAEPILMTLVSPGSGLTAGHLLVVVAANAHATVIVDHVGSGLYAGDISVRLGDGASLTLLALQRMDEDAVLLGNVRATVGRDANLRAVALTLDGDLVRLATRIAYDGPGGEAEILGAFFTGEGQHQEHRVFVDHSAPHCRSDVAYKGALAGHKAHSIWIGDVLIRAEAVGTQTYELNRNLVLTDGARADAVPNLEIETGEIISAGHAAATGRFDEEQLFYLQSRGISAAEARRLVVRGFFAEVLRRIGVADVERQMLAAVDAKLADLPASEAVSG